MKLRILTLCALTLALAACGGGATPTTAVTIPPLATAPPTATVTPPTPTPEPPVAPAATTAATFEAAPCPFRLPAGQVEGETVECGYLLVPENRADPDTSTLRLAVAIFRHPDGASEPDPIIYLSGGPGGSSLEFIWLAFDRAFTPFFAANRDLILFDQRGVGLSEPVLDCPAVDELSLELLDSELDGQQLSTQEVSELIVKAIGTCAQDLGAVADLAAYNSAANAADVNDLRLALGYDQVNLWGTSYGTRLALTVMRDFSEGLRSVVLDAVYQPDVDLYLELPANMDRAFDTLFDHCAADAACDAAYPDLRAVFFDTVERLQADPAPIELVNALTRERYDALLDGDSLVGILFRYLYLTEVVPSLPQMIYDASQGDYDLLVLVQGSLLAQQEVMRIGMQLSVQCHEEYAFGSLEEFERALADYPELTSLLENALTGELGFQICADWGSGRADAVENEPVRSDVPTLLMVGEYDPITPPAWARHAATTLDNSYFFEYPGIGHGASAVEGCPREMMLAFLKEPTAAPDDACIATLDTRFVVPGAGSEAVEFEAYANQQMGIRGIAPAGWTEAAPGVFTRGSSGLDVASLIEQAAPVSAESLLDLLVQQIGLEETPEPAGEREANGLTWTLYAVTVQGLAVDIALAESEGLALIVILQSAQDEHDALYEAVFVPAIDALVPIE